MLPGSCYLDLFFWLLSKENALQQDLQLPSSGGSAALLSEGVFPEVALPMCVENLPLVTDPTVPTLFLARGLVC